MLEINKDNYKGYVELYKIRQININHSFWRNGISKFVIFDELMNHEIKIKKKYPYVELNIGSDDLSIALYRANILKFSIGKGVEIKDKDFENYINCENIKQQLLSEKSYKHKLKYEVVKKDFLEENKFKINIKYVDGVTIDELKRVKTKKLKKLKNYR